jgi:hypothetical protein
MQRNTNELKQILLKFEIIPNKMYLFHERQLKSIKICVIVLNILLLLYAFYAGSETSGYLNYDKTKEDDKNQVLFTIHKTFHSICIILLTIIYTIGVVGTFKNNRSLLLFSVIVLIVVVSVALFCLFGPLYDHFSHKALIWIAIHLFLIAFQFIYFNAIKTSQNSIIL